MLSLLDGYYRTWTNAQIRKQRWAIPSYIDDEDLWQDAYCIYLKLKRKYPLDKDGITETNEKNLFGLFKKSFLNHLCDLRAQRTTYTAADFREDPTDDRSEGHLGDFCIKLDKLSVELKSLVKFIFSDDGREFLSQPYVRREDGTRETRNERLCRAIGVDASVSIRDLFNVALSN